MVKKSGEDDWDGINGGISMIVKWTHLEMRDLEIKCCCIKARNKVSLKKKSFFSDIFHL